MLFVLTESDLPWGPTGRAVYDRTYARVKPNGEKENWFDTVRRVIHGNISLVDPKFIEADEERKLYQLMTEFKVLPAGRHLWMSGVPGRQFLMNCWAAGWTENPSDHFTFSYDQLLQGGGVGANYSNRYLTYGPIQRSIDLHFVCDPRHPNYEEFAHLVSAEYSHEWDGAIRVDDSREGFVDTLDKVVSTYFAEEDGDISALVFDVSLIRPRGSRIKTFGGIASGPGPLVEGLYQTVDYLNHRVGKKLTSLDAMEIDHRMAEIVQSGNVRRSARMSIKNWQDEDIFDFISCKTDHKSHWTTNISVEIDDAFFKALKAKTKKGEHARAVYEAVIEGMLTNGEPGFYNRTLAQKGEVGEVATTNPCAEIALESWEPCNLGHINLDAFADDIPGAKEAHRLMARFLIRATFGDIVDPKSREIIAKNRRIGVGHFGYQGFCIKRGIRYSDSWRDTNLQRILADFYSTVRAESDSYAFALRIPAPIKVTTVAPTGTIAKLAGRTEGIHPLIYDYYERRVRYSESDPALPELIFAGYRVEDDIYSAGTKVVVFPTKDILLDEVEHAGIDPELIETAEEISLADLLSVQQMYQTYYADNAVSFTVNLPADKYSVDEVKKTLIHHLPYLKGTTIMVDATRPQPPYTKITKEEYESQSNQTVSDAVDDCRMGACPVR